jgi:hypothetical protein
MACVFLPPLLKPRGARMVHQATFLMRRNRPFHGRGPLPRAAAWRGSRARSSRSPWDRVALVNAEVAEKLEKMRAEERAKLAAAE